MEKYEKVLNLMRSKGGRVELTDPELLTLLERENGKKNLTYRISAYMWSIRKIAHLDVRSIRQGRKVVAYELESMIPAGGPVEPQDEPVCSLPPEHVPAAVVAETVTEEV